MMSSFQTNPKIGHDVAQNLQFSCNVEMSDVKGQLISKCPFGIIVWTKLPTKLFLDFCPEFFVASWGLPGSFLGFLGT